MRQDCSMREFRPLDYVLLASGCMIFQSSITRIIDKIQKVVLVAHTLYFLSQSLPWVFRHGINRSVLKHASGLLDAVFALIFIQVMSVKREDMRILLETMAKHLEEKRRDCLRQYAIVSSLLTWINVFRLIGFSIMLFLRVKEKHGFQNNFVLITCYGYLISWLFGGIAVYGFYVKTLTYVEEEYFDRLDNIVKNDLTWSIDSLCIENRVIMHLKEDIVTCFGPIPCLWLVHTFIRATGIMFTHGTDRQITKSVTLTIDVLALVWLIFLCEHAKQKAKDKTSHIRMEMLRRGKTDKWQNLVHELEEAEKLNFSAWNMFTIRKTVIPAFVGSLGNFMVLVSQMIRDLSENNERRAAMNITRNSTMY